jgi:hypothetical protein
LRRDKNFPHPFLVTLFKRCTYRPIAINDLLVNTVFENEDVNINRAALIPLDMIGYAHSLARQTSLNLNAVMSSTRLDNLGTDQVDRVVGCVRYVRHDCATDHNAAKYRPQIFANAIPEVLAC